MKLILFLLTVLIILPGCLTVVEPPERTYREGDTITHYFLVLPYEEKEVSIRLQSPDGKEKGTFTSTHYGPSDFYIGETLLYHPGIWKVFYTVGEDREGIEYLWVEPKTKTLARFELEDVRETSFSVRNVGKEPGYVDVVVFARNPVTVGEKQFYGYTYLEEETYLRVGHKETYNIPNKEVYIMIEGEIK
jgi:hypothetical protein